MSEAAPFKKVINYQKSSTYKEAFVTNFWGGSNHLSRYIDVFCCEETIPEIELESMTIAPLEGNAVSDYSKVDNKDWGARESGGEHSNGIIHARLKMDYDTALALRNFLNDFLSDETARTGSSAASGSGSEAHDSEE